MRVVFCSSEVLPFAKTGGLADVCGTLPLILEKYGINVAIVMPRYQCVDAKKFTVRPLNQNISTAKIGQNINVYFVENKRLFDRDGLYGDEKGDYEDNLERFSYYGKAALELLKEANLKTDIIHCHDWQAALIPVYLKTAYKNDPFYAKIKSILTIHNLAYQGLFAEEEFPLLGLNDKLFGVDGLEFYGNVNLLKGGIIFSDAVTTVSRQYAKEIQTPKFGCGLEGVLRKKKNILGINNGVDGQLWNPETDAFLAKNYSAGNIEDKYVNKRELQKKLKLDAKKDVPLVGFVGRLSSQKGLDLVYEAVDEIVKLDVQMVFLGVGEEKYQNILRAMAKKYPKKIAAYLQFDEPMAHLVYAGSDIFLMPSVYEPCGLSQMISLRYGTIPLVFKTGGLADTIKHFDSADHQGNGFVFDIYKKEALVKTMKIAVKAYHDKDIFNRLVLKSFGHDFSWKNSAAEYKKLYEETLAGH